MADVKVVLADFGFAVNINEEADSLGAGSVEASYVCGTTGYFAPEIINHCELNLKADIFSTACLLYNLITGKQLFYSLDKNEFIENNRHCRMPVTFLEDISSCSEDLQYLIRCMLNPQPQKRPTAR